jgi:hypothetical protein
MAGKDLLIVFVAWLGGVFFGGIAGCIVGQRLAHDDCVLQQCVGRCPAERASLEHNTSLDWRKWTCRCQ